MTQRLPRVLVLCTGNSCRSQMAEAILNQDLQGQVTALSAGTVPQPAVAAGALEALQRAGYPTEGLFPKTVNSVLSEDIDLIVTVCDRAEASCPGLPDGTQRLHLPFHDPHGEALASFEAVRDDIRQRLVSAVSTALQLSAPAPAGSCRSGHPS